VGTCDVADWSEVKVALFAHGAEKQQDERWVQFGGFKVTRPKP
jgi:hypothetical protein